MKKAIILGVGPEEGLGAQLALRFAKEGMHVFVGSRTQSVLEELVAKIEKVGGEATAVSTFIQLLRNPRIPSGTRWRMEMAIGY